MGESIDAWLKRQGLGEYATAFESNNIDLEIAATLTDGDLLDLGVVPLGDRKRLLRALRSSPDRDGGGQDSELQRRYLTVLFCDLVDSTRLSVLLDPEVLATLIGNYQRCCTELIAEYDGFVARYVGDGILAYFGYPRAQEHAAERAIRSGLSIVRSIEQQELLPGLRVHVRIGIATGLAVAGDLPGGMPIERNVVVGEMPNLAARLQGTAGPNAVVISPTTHRLVGRMFHCTELPAVELKGLMVPIVPWQVLGEVRLFNRFDARRASGLIPLYGRTIELEMLLAHWRTACAGTCQFVHLGGEAGIGKSRLVDELANQIAGRSCSRIDWTGSPYLQNTPLGAVIAHLEAASGCLPNDPAPVRRTKLSSHLTAGIGSDASLSLLAPVLSLPALPTDPPADPDARRRKLQILETLADLVVGTAERQPTLLVCEDVHWFDPTTLELMEVLADRLASRRVLCLLTFRPERSPPDRRGQFAKIDLTRLAPDSSAAIIREISRGKALSAEIVDLIVDRSDGIPLFIEELTKSVLETAYGARGKRPSEQWIIPDTLRELLIARLDRLPSAREVAQIGAAIGREFSEELVASVATLDRVSLGRALDQLIASDLLHRHALATGTTYVFKHALVRDAAYETLLHSRRRTIHHRIAEALERLHPEAAEARPELLAQHWEGAGELGAAIRHWTLAGQRAAAASAASEAYIHLRRALDLVDQLPASGERNQTELVLTVQLGSVLRATRGPAGLETGAAFRRGRDLCRLTNDHSLLAPALAGLYGFHLVRAENDSAGEAARELLALAEARQDRLYRMIGHRAVGAVLVHAGEPLSARQHLEQSLSFYDNSTDGPLAFVYGTDHAQTASSFLAFSLWLLGFPDQAQQREHWALAHGARVKHVYSLAQTAMFRILVRSIARDWTAALELAERTHAMATEHSFQLAAAATRFWGVLARSRVGIPGRSGVGELESAVAEWVNAGALNYRPWLLAQVAEVHAAAGNAAAAVDLITEAASIAEQTGEAWIEPELLRLTGEFELARDPAAGERAEQHYRQAIDIARRRSLRMWELRASTSLARLLRNRSDARSAYHLLSPIYASFDEGHGEADLRDAAALLEGCASML